LKQSDEVKYYPIRSHRVAPSC